MIEEDGKFDLEDIGGIFIVVGLGRLYLPWHKKKIFLELSHEKDPKKPHNSI